MNQFMPNSLVSASRQPQGSLKAASVEAKIQLWVQLWFQSYCWITIGNSKIISNKPLVRPLKCPTKQLWIIFKNSFLRPPKEGKMQVSIHCLPSVFFFEKICNLGIIRYRFRKEISISESLLVRAFIFGPYVIVGSLHIWVGRLCSLCWGQIEAEPRFLGMNWSIRV